MMPHEGENNYRHNLLLNILVVNLNVLRVLMKSGIGRDEDNNLIITMDGHWRSIIIHGKSTNI